MSERIKTVTVEVEIPCDHCDGTGKRSLQCLNYPHCPMGSITDPCHACAGRGYYQTPRKIPLDDFIRAFSKRLEVLIGQRS